MILVRIKNFIHFLRNSKVVAAVHYFVILGQGNNGLSVSEQF